MSEINFQIDDSLVGKYKVLKNKFGNEDFVVKVKSVFENEGIGYAAIEPINCGGFEREVPIEILSDIPKFVEDKQKMLDKFLETLRLCSCAGNIIHNDLVELKSFVDEHNEEWVRPIFRNGAGKNGYYDVKVSGDSNIAIIMDVVENFVRRMW